MRRVKKLWYSGRLVKKAVLRSQVWYRAELDTSKKFSPTWNQSSSRNPLQFSQCFAWFSIAYRGTCFWVYFCLFYDIIFICKLAMKLYLMRTVFARISAASGTKKLISAAPPMRRLFEEFHITRKNTKLFHNDKGVRSHRWYFRSRYHETFFTAWISLVILDLLSV